MITEVYVVDDGSKRYKCSILFVVDYLTHSETTRGKMLHSKSCTLKVYKILWTTMQHRCILCILRLWLHGEHDEYTFQQKHCLLLCSQHFGLSAGYKIIFCIFFFLHISQHCKQTIQRSLLGWNLKWSKTAELQKDISPHCSLIFSLPNFYGCAFSRNTVAKHLQSNTFLLGAGGDAEPQGKLTSSFLSQHSIVASLSGLSLSAFLRSLQKPHVCGLGVHGRKDLHKQIIDKTIQ